MVKGQSPFVGCSLERKLTPASGAGLAALQASQSWSGTNVCFGRRWGRFTSHFGRLNLGDFCATRDQRGNGSADEPRVLDSRGAEKRSNPCASDASMSSCS